MATIPPRPSRRRHRAKARRLRDREAPSWRRWTGTTPASFRNGHNRGLWNSVALPTNRGYRPRAAMSTSPSTSPLRWSATSTTGREVSMRSPCSTSTCRKNIRTRPPATKPMTASGTDRPDRHRFDPDPPSRPVGPRPDGPSFTPCLRSRPGPRLGGRVPPPVQMRSKLRASSQSVTTRLAEAHSCRAVFTRWSWTSGPKASAATSLRANRSTASANVVGTRGTSAAT
jgi:hypothetical protein